MNSSELSQAESEFLAAVVDRHCRESGIFGEHAQATLAKYALSFYRQGATTEKKLLDALRARAIMLRANEI